MLESEPVVSLVGKLYFFRFVFVELPYFHAVGILPVSNISFVADIREAVASNAGVIPLHRLDGAYESAAAYALLQVRFDTFPGDYDLGDTVDLTDLAYIGDKWMGTDTGSVADIAGPNGVPDGAVDYFDLRLLSRDYLKDANDPNTW